MKKYILIYFLFYGLCFILAAADCRGQSVVQRTVNLESSIPAEKDIFYFDFTHRFTVSRGPSYKAINYPTFILAFGAFDNTEIKLRYASNSELVPSLPNEMEVMAKYNFFNPGAASDLSIAAAPAYNFTTKSFDGIIPVEWRMSKELKTIINITWLGNSVKNNAFEVLLGAGIVYYLEEKISVSIDANNLLTSPVWGFGLNFEIPRSPHTLSLQITDASTNTIQGSAFKTNDLRYGFEFTIKFY